MEINIEIESIAKFLFTKTKDILNSENGQYKRVCKIDFLLKCWLNLEFIESVELDVEYFKLKEELRDEFLCKYISERLYSL